MTWVRTLARSLGCRPARPALTQIWRDDAAGTRIYRDAAGALYRLVRAPDATVPAFEAYGPYAEDFGGTLPRLAVDGREFWGEHWSWRRAARALARALVDKETDHALHGCR